MKSGESKPESLTPGIRFLMQSRKFGMKLGLDSMRSLVGRLGNPERSLRFIHLAGTNGKGSTAAFLASALEESGKRVGLFTSPHLISLQERIQVNRTPISRESLEAALSRIQELVGDRVESEMPSFFEIMTAAALIEFERQQVEMVVWETGMGGRLDATNVVTPEVSVITQIGMDHMAYLGETLVEIAGEKAGIIKAEIPVVSGVREMELAEVIRRRAALLKSTLLEIDDFQLSEIESWSLGLKGGFQRRNAACARAALKCCGLEDLVIRRGFEKAWWPGRFQVIRKDPPIVLDGAHNESAARVLVAAWQEFYPDQKPHLIFGAMADKEIDAVIRELRTIAARVTLVRPRNERSANPADLQKGWGSIPVVTRESLSAIWREIQSEPEPVLITGSLFLVGEALMLGEGKEDDEGWRWNERLSAKGDASR